ncbi:ArsR/SmtB family transcription factor [Halopiger djelfimassiliensis]|uniref:ArsR/SmtB family transcription factor n=1 Tax=Halopiger djelfimassiliensis TaxID=1293047 RepID=UPI000677C198|nr:helix-turn-helix domain-containing protein [Halopiger djelfimassiliensis]
MARLFPFRSETSTQDGQPRVVDLEGEDADAVFSALSSTTARRIYARLDDEPATPSDLADAIDSSIQNVRYHLEKLEDAGLVEVVDTWYSSRGNEMSVYATTDGPLIVTSDESKAAQLKRALSRLIGGVGALAGGSLLVQYGLTRWFSGSQTGGTDGGMVTTQDDAGGDASGGDDPGADTRDGTESDADVGVQDTEETGEGMENGAENGYESGAENGYENGADDASGDVSEEMAENISGNGSLLDGDNGTADSLGDGVADGADAVFQTVPPGLLFFLGGLAVLLAVTIYWYWYRPTY